MVFARRVNSRIIAFDHDSQIDNHITMALDSPQALTTTCIPPHSRTVNPSRHNPGSLGMPLQFCNAGVMLTDVATFVVGQIPNTQLSTQTACRTPIHGGAKSCAFDGIYNGLGLRIVPIPGARYMGHDG